MREITNPTGGCKGILIGSLLTLGMAVLCTVGYFVILALTGNLG